MSLAVREVSVEKGYDPRDFVLVASGGAGPLHVVAIARELHIPTVIVPLFPVAFLGARHADGGRAARFHSHLSTPTRAASISRRCLPVRDEMIEEAQACLRHAKDGATLQVLLDLRYIGQEFTLSVPVTPAQLKKRRPRGIRIAFDELHEQRYAHHRQRRAGGDGQYSPRRASAGGRSWHFPQHAARKRPTPTRRPVYLRQGCQPVDCPIYDRDDFGRRPMRAALIEEPGARR